MLGWASSPRLMLFPTWCQTPRGRAQNCAENGSAYSEVFPLSPYIQSHSIHAQLTDHLWDGKYPSLRSGPCFSSLIESPFTKTLTSNLLPERKQMIMFSMNMIRVQVVIIECWETPETFSHSFEILVRDIDSLRRGEEVALLEVS